VHWQNVKPELAGALKKAGVNVLNRVMIVDLLKDSAGRVTGATAINTRTGDFIVIRAKITVLATAACSRVYNPETPVPGKYKFRYHWCPASVSGDGWGMGFRAGAEMANMEQAGRGFRPRDDSCFPIGNQNNEGSRGKYFTADGEEFAIPKPPLLEELERTGRDPFYVSIQHLSDDFHKRVEVDYVDERMISMKIAQDRGFDPRTHWFEMIDNRPNQLHTEPGIQTNAYFETNLPGLYAIGDCVSGQHDVANAATAGCLMGEAAFDCVKGVPDPAVDEAQVEMLKEATMRPLNTSDGEEPMELELTIRHICNRYIGTATGEGRLKEAIRRLDSIKREFLNKMVAQNPHYLMRALEVRNLFDVAEMHAKATLERRETRDAQVRLDCPEPDPKLRTDKMPAKIDYKKCIGCKKCYDLCPIDVFTMDEQTNMPAATYNEECWHCGICWMECPKRAIDITYPASFW
jgi:succinate dehydrogenase/fumarate reductase flavoprotein subunit